jgi:hypothetical protein
LSRRQLINARTTLLVAILSTSVLAAAHAAERRAVTASGRWRVSIAQPATGCRWIGHVAMDQRGATLNGRGAARRVEGARCPPSLAGKISGSVQGVRVRFGFAFGRLGQASFVGRIDAGGGGMSGSWATRSASGDWSATR